MIDKKKKDINPYFAIIAQMKYKSKSFFEFSLKNEGKLLDFIALFRYNDEKASGGSFKKMKSLFSGEYVLESERLIFRPIVKEDCDDVYAYSKEEAVTRYLLWSPHASLRESARYIRRVRQLYAQGAYFDFALMEKESRRMIGTCGFTSFCHAANTAEIGYVLASDKWRMGYGREAVKTIAAFAFDTLGLSALEVRFMEGNIASRALAESCGFVFEGFLPKKLAVKGGMVTVGRAVLTKSAFEARFPDIVMPLRRSTPCDYPKVSFFKRFFRNV